MSTKMQAGQVYFKNKEYQRIKSVAKSQNISFAEFMRRAALEKITREQDKKDKVNIFEIKPFDWKSDFANDGAENHDKYIYNTSHL